MELIIGGAYSGKLTCAVKSCGFSEDALYDLKNGLPKENSAPVCLYHLEAFTRHCSAIGMDAEETVKMLEPYAETDGTVIVSREIGCGIVPMDAAERAYRELHGQVLRILAEKAGHVIRVFAGLEEVLK